MTPLSPEDMEKAPILLGPIEGVYLRHLSGYQPASGIQYKNMFNTIPTVNFKNIEVLGRKVSPKLIKFPKSCVRNTK
jgi:hypothetical protein